MRDPKFYVIVIIAAVVVDLVITFGMIAGYTEWTQGEKVGYDCRISEISPDVPVKVKERCREIKHGNN